jgi:G patch domain-containing protein 1
VDSKDLTEWEKEKERDEFQHRYQQHVKKLDSVRKETLKFVSTSTLNAQNQEVGLEKKKDEDIAFFKPMCEVEPEENLTEMQKAAKEKKFGKLTRVEYEWRPHPIVCKRFNIPNPHPE